MTTDPRVEACPGFAWVGQSLRYCDRCGLPYWEHTHEERMRPEAGPFDADPWTRVPIPPARAEAVREKWGQR